MSILIFDTETTGKANFKAAPEAAFQPRLVQLGAAIYDDVGKEMASVDLLVKPDGFEIPAEAASIHGITTEIATAHGIPLKTALGILRAMQNATALIAGHNSDYDAFIIAGERKRMGAENGEMKCLCTMKAATPLCKLPGPYGFKWPKLTEAYQFAFGETFEGAHSALVDVRATARLFFWLKQQGKI